MTKAVTLNPVAAPVAPAVPPVPPSATDAIVKDLEGKAKEVRVITEGPQAGTVRVDW